MNKLQLYIAKSLRGYKSLVNLNPAEDVRRHIGDLRQALAVVDYDPLEKNIFYLVSYIDEGTLLSILRTIPTEPLDHLAATVFVPAEMQIRADELGAVVRAITRKMSAPGMSADDIAELRRLFARDYPDRPADEQGAMVASDSDGQYASALYGGATGRTLDTYLGEHLYQPAWLPYAGVLLLDADMGLGGNAPDLTGPDPASTTPLLPPDRGDGGFEPHIYGRVFDRPFLVPMGSTVDIAWTRPGFEQRMSSVLVRKPGITAEAATTDDARKTLSPASFMVTSLADRTPLPDAVVTVNGTRIDGQHTFTESELASAHVVVSCPGYTTYSGRIDMAGSTIAHIRLGAPGKVYRFQLPVRSAEIGAPVTFEIRSKQPVTDSPIEGYEALDTIREGASRVNLLAFAGSTGGWRRPLIAAAGGLLLGILLGFCLFAGGSDEKVSRRDSVAVESPLVEPEPVAAPSPAVAASTPAPAPAQEEPAPAPDAAASPAEAVKYLDSNRTWNRTEMDRYPVLAGLFDDMNALRLDRLTGQWAQTLKDSKNFAAVVRAAEGSARKKIDVHRNGRTTYNKPGDDAIGYVGYTYWIDP